MDNQRRAINIQIERLEEQDIRRIIINNQRERLEEKKNRLQLIYIILVIIYVIATFFMVFIKNKIYFIIITYCYVFTMGMCIGTTILYALFMS
uniref:Uncharacterized protein n=1 Tax=viral metagenome TaxID=1070528 RepID=A0A6C0H4S5_9ZZZZ